MRYLLILFGFVFALHSTAQQADPLLEKKINSLISDYRGDVGIFVKDLKTNKIAAINADTVFPTASIIKIPILIGIMDKINKGEFQFHQQMIYTDSLYYNEGGDILSMLKDSSEIELGKVISLMLSFSDNCASLWLQGLSGGGVRINELLDSLGYDNTRVNSRTAGRKSIWEIYGWGQTTPKEMATILESIVKGEIINKEMSEKMLRLLGRQYWDEVAISQIPPAVFVASKSGAVDQSRNEVLYVNGKNSTYIFSVFTKNNKDTTWDKNNEAWELTRKLSALLWNYFNTNN